MYLNKFRGSPVHARKHTIKYRYYTTCIKRFYIISSSFNIWVVTNIECYLSNHHWKKYWRIYTLMSVISKWEFFLTFFFLSFYLISSSIGKKTMLSQKGKFLCVCIYTCKLFFFFLNVLEYEIRLCGTTANETTFQ